MNFDAGLVDQREILVPRARRRGNQKRNSCNRKKAQ
jgi:hypothetical protein